MKTLIFLTIGLIDNYLLTILYHIMDTMKKNKKQKQIILVQFEIYTTSRRKVAV